MKAKKSEQEWNVSKSDIEYALSIIDNVPSKNGMVSSEFIRVSGRNKTTVFALGAELAAEAYLPIEYPFSKPIYLDRRLFEPFVACGKEMPIDVYTMAMKKKGVLSVKHGKRSAVFGVHKKVSGYSELPEYPEDAKTMRIYESWTKAMGCAVACATDDPVAPNLNCVYILPVNAKELRLYASNIKVVFIGRGTTKKAPKHPIAFPLMLARKLEGNDMETITWDDKSATASSERGALWQPVKSAARKKFPVAELDGLVEKLSATKPVMMLNAEEISEAAVHIANYLTAVSREDLILKIRASKDDVRARFISGTGDTQFTEHITLLKPAKADVSLSWPLDEVLPALEFSKNQGNAAIHLSEDGISMFATEDIKLVVAKESK
jgi:hypothetical protein